MIKTLMKTVATVGSIVAVGAGLASAQFELISSKPALVSNPAQTLTSLHAEAIIPVLDELNIQYQGATLPNGRKVVLAQSPTGIKFQLTPTACDEKGDRCRGVSSMALFQTNAPARVVSSFNARYAFVSAGQDDSGVAYISRYDIADYGMARGNFAVSVVNFLQMAALLDRQLYEATNTVRLDASDKDLAAEGLNMKSILADSSMANKAGLSTTSHRVSFEMVPETIDTFIRADDLAPGRLINHVNGER